MNTKVQGFELNDPVVDMDAMTVNFRFAADTCDMADQAIVDAVVKAAQEAGITQLYLLDRDFVLEAIREKLEREGGAADAVD